jgi:hypothetical protein
MSRVVKSPAILPKPAEAASCNLILFAIDLHVGGVLLENPAKSGGSTQPAQAQLPAQFSRQE